MNKKKTGRSRTTTPKKVNSTSAKMTAGKRKSDAGPRKAGTGKRKTDASAGTAKRRSSSGNKKSATVQSIERMERLSQTMPLGGLTDKLPNLGGMLDDPIRRTVAVKKKKNNKGNIRRTDYGTDYGTDYDSLDREGLNRKLKIFIIIAAAIMVTAVILAVIVNMYHVDTVIIEGNSHYTNDEIYNMVIGDSRLAGNSIYLSLKYKNKEIKDIPFIETMNVKIVDTKTIRITVYEKAVAGYVEYLGRYFYFDKDGTVIESTDTASQGIPQIMGLDFDHVVLYERLPVENEEIFKQILDMTQLLKKYEIEMDKLYFDSKYNMTLYFGDARIKIGDFDYIDEKIIKLKSILPELEGKKGVLRLDSYDGSSDLITFEVDD